MVPDPASVPSLASGGLVEIGLEVVAFVTEEVAGFTARVVVAAWRGTRCGALAFEYFARENYPDM